MTQTEQYYNTYWRGEDGWHPSSPIDAELREWINQWLEPSERLLDVGCGDGRSYGWYLLKSGRQVYGVDVSPVAVASARELGIDAQQADLNEGLPFNDEHFDGVVSFEVLEHLFDPETAVREIWRVLKPGGQTLVTVPNVAAWRNRLEMVLLGHFNPGGSPVTARRAPWRDPHVRFFTPKTLRRMLMDAGFSVIRSGGVHSNWLGDVPGVRRMVASRVARPVEGVARWVGRGWPMLLCGRCIALAQKPSQG